MTCISCAHDDDLPASPCFTPLNTEQIIFCFRPTKPPLLWDRPHHVPDTLIARCTHHANFSPLVGRLDSLFRFESTYLTAHSVPGQAACSVPALPSIQVSVVQPFRPLPFPFHHFYSSPSPSPHCSRTNAVTWYAHRNPTLPTH